MQSSSAQVMGQLSDPLAFRIMLETGAQVILVIRLLGGYGAPLAISAARVVAAAAGRVDATLTDATIGLMNEPKTS